MLLNTYDKNTKRTMATVYVVCVRYNIPIICVL